MTIIKTACVQLNAGPEIGANLKQAEALIREAAGRGAQFIATPENTCHIRNPQTEKLKTAKPEAGHEAIPFFSDLARALGIWLLIGSMSIKVSPPLTPPPAGGRSAVEGGRVERIANRSFLFDDQGQIVARYDKIHLFDVDLPTGESHRESALMIPGERAVVAGLPWAKLGLTICYDVRFSYLYRDLAKAGAAIIAVPAAFTVPTGQAHWQTLLRARAIETGSFIVAPAQCGAHEGGRQTYGHSLIVGPWGEVLAEGGEAPGVISADLDLAAVEKARVAIPALKHDRVYREA